MAENPAFAHIYAVFPGTKSPLAPEDNRPRTSLGDRCCSTLPGKLSQAGSSRHSVCTTSTWANGRVRKSPGICKALVKGYQSWHGRVLRRVPTLPRKGTHEGEQWDVLSACRLLFAPGGVSCMLNCASHEMCWSSCARVLTSDLSKCAASKESSSWTTQRRLKRQSI